MNWFQKKLVTEGYCDARGAGFCAAATSLPNGEYGIVALCVKGNALSIYDVDMRSNLGELMYQIELAEIEDLKIRTGIFSQILRFTYKGSVYSFTNFIRVKPALQVIEEESQK